MIEWELGDQTLRVTDVDNAELAVRGGNLSVSDDDGLDVPRPVDDTVVARATHLEFPHAVVYAFSPGSNDRYELSPSGEPLTLGPGEYVVDVDTEIKTYLRFSSRAIIEKTPDFESVVVSFPEPTQVVLGFRSRHELPAGTITVPDEPSKVAEAISHLAASHKTDGPDRTYPTLRGHPSLIESGDELSIPDYLKSDAPDTGIELVVPPDYESLYVTAPLAYYLQASVRTADAGTTTSYTEGPGTGPDGPVLRLPDRGIERRLSPMPTLERDVQQLLRKSFFLDCLVRNAGPYGTALAEETVLEELNCDASDLYEGTPQQRLAAYLDVPFSAIEDRIPEWHLSTYVAPEFDRVETLPFLLDRMSLIYRPRTSVLEGQELIERSLDDFYRGPNGADVTGGGTAGTGVDDGDRSSAGEVASVDVVKPELRHGRVHGWLADGVPIDVFKSAPEAYHNRLDYLERSSDSTSIRVVLNDPEMAGEYDEVAPIYRQRSEELPIDVAVEESLEMADLARIFESDHDFVHYIGHCETDGFRCPDGYLSVSSLEECNTQTFFLNACGSYHEGKRLIEKGSVAGAVTFSKVLNDHAVRVGSTFAKLLLHGFSIERALGLARRRIMMGKDYAVVGDGTHSLTQAEHRFPATVRIDPLEGESADTSQTAADAGRMAGRQHSSERYHVAVDCYMTSATGAYYYPHTGDNQYAYLCGNEASMTLSRPELSALLKETEASVIYDGDLYWSEELWPRFERGRERERER